MANLNPRNNNGRIILDQSIIPGKSYDSSTMNNNGLYIYNLTDLNSLKLGHSLSVKENAPKKLLNVFLKGHRHDSSNDLVINQVLNFNDDDNQNEIKDSINK
jgi:hypothetical protein